MANPPVRLSVHPSVKRVYCDKTKEPPANFIIPYERSIHPVYRHEEWLVGSRPLVPEILGQTDPFPLQNADFQPIFARSASAVASRKKVQLSLIGSLPRAFQLA